jgi:DNA/RNA-binding domain of Phe-tRNA-synthetase-like protein
MRSVTVEPDLARLLPGFRLGLVEAAQIEVQPTAPALWTMVEELGERLRVELRGRAAADRAPIAATRRAYRALGDDPTRYRPANEALLRRILRNESAHGTGSLLSVHSVVDVNNYVSLESGYALGCYDLALVQGKIVARKARAEERYAPIGKPEVNAANRLVLVDEAGIFGCPTADSQRTLVGLDTHALLFVIFAFDAPDGVLEQAVARTATLLERFCAARDVERRVEGG